MPKPKRNQKKKKNVVIRYRKQPILLGGFPASKMVKLRYSQEISINPISNSYAQHVFRANSVYDPDYTTTGHQPLYYDQWATNYTRSTVVGSKITIQWVPQSNVNLTPGMFGCELMKVPSIPYTALDTLYESTRGRFGRTTGIVQSQGGQKVSTVSKTFSARKFMGVSNVKDNSDLQGLMGGTGVGTNPAQNAYYAVWLASIGANDPSTTFFRVVIDYIVLLQEPKLVTQS